MKNTQLNFYTKEEKSIAFICDGSAASIQNYKHLGNEDIAVISLDNIQEKYLDEVDVLILNSSNDILKEFDLSQKSILSFNDIEIDFDSIDEVDNVVSTTEKKNIGLWVQRISILFFVFFVGYGFATMIPVYNVKEFISVLPNEFYIMLAVGFFAQLVDGALGLGYGMTSAAAMMSMGIKLPAISGSIHTAEMFSSAVSGYSHYKFGNVNKKMLIWLAIPGVIGAVLGSLFVIYIGEEYEHYAYPFVALYLLIIAIRLLAIAFKNKIVRKKINRIGLLGFSGGFFDAFGGGGWGPIVTSTLLTKGRQSKYVVGTVSLAEFFVTFAATMTFFTSLGVEYWYIVLGLIIGGMVAAPVAAKLAGKLPRKIAYLLVALLVIISSVRIILKLI